MKTIKSFILIKFPVFAVMLAAFLALSCAQDAIFSNISNEPEPKDALIKGSPTNMVVLGDKIYVGTHQGRTIYVFDGNFWSSIQANGSIVCLTTDGNLLYALVSPSGEPFESTLVQKYDPAEGWTGDLIIDPSAGSYNVQTVFCTPGGKIFAGAQSVSNYLEFGILYAPSPDSPLILVKESASLLKGAALDKDGNIFLATAGSGILKVNRDSIAATVVANDLKADAVTGTGGMNMTGIIATGETILAVGNERNGNGVLFTSGKDAEGDIFNAVTSSYKFTGALCIWKNFDSEAEEWKPAALLMGIQVSSTIYGYRELDLSVDGTPSTSIRLMDDDNPPLSAKNYAMYKASIGKYPVRAILQVPETLGSPDMTNPDNAGWEPRIFASTAVKGLWSYKNGQWNAETND